MSSDQGLVEKCLGTKTICRREREREGGRESLSPTPAMSATDGQEELEPVWRDLHHHWRRCVCTLGVCEQWVFATTLVSYAEPLHCPLSIAI